MTVLNRQSFLEQVSSDIAIVEKAQSHVSALLMLISKRLDKKFDNLNDKPFDANGLYFAKVAILLGEDVRHSLGAAIDAYQGIKNKAAVDMPMTLDVNQQVLGSLENAITQESKYRIELGCDKVLFVHHGLQTILTELDALRQSDSYSEDDEGDYGDLPGQSGAGGNHDKLNIYVHLYNTRGEKIEDWTRILSRRTSLVQLIENHRVFTDEVEVAREVKEVIHDPCHGYLQLAVPAKNIVTVNDPLEASSDIRKIVEIESVFELTDMISFSYCGQLFAIDVMPLKDNEKSPEVVLTLVSD